MWYMYMYVCMIKFIYFREPAAIPEYSFHVNLDQPSKELGSM